MKCVVYACLLLIALTVPAAAETDNFARSKLIKQEKRIGTLEAQVQALTTLVNELRTENIALKGKVETNQTLIKALAKTVAP